MFLSKASVKLIEDLLLSIERKDRISLQFGPQYQECPCVPYSIEFHSRDAFLVAWDLHQEEPRIYALDEIRSYVPSHYPHELEKAEKEKLQELVLMMNHSNINTYQPFVYEKELML